MEKLAIKGGKPIRENFLPYGTQWLDEKEINEVIDCLKSKWITTGPKMRKFEDLQEIQVCPYCGEEKEEAMLCCGECHIDVAYITPDGDFLWNDEVEEWLNAEVIVEPYEEDPMDAYKRHIEQKLCEEEDNK